MSELATVLSRRAGPCATALLLGLGLSAGAAEANAVEVYRCEGQPAIYTSDPRLVRAGRCTPLGAARTAAGVRPVAATTPPPRVNSAPAPAPAARQAQQQRDSDRVQILQSELARERERLAQLTQQLRALGPAADEPTVGTRADATALAQAIRRSETDVDALDKELARALR